MKKKILKYWKIMYKENTMYPLNFPISSSKKNIFSLNLSNERILKILMKWGNIKKDETFDSLSIYLKNSIKQYS